MMVLGGRTFGRCWGNEGGALLNDISIFMKKTPQGSQEPSAQWGHNKKLAARRGPSLEPEHANSLILGI